jgi:hypothetical protein
MKARPRRGHALGAALVLATFAVGVANGEGAPVSPVAAGDHRRSDAGARRRPAISAVPRPAARPVPWRRITESESPDPRQATPPAGYLIHLIDGGEPIVVTRYVEEKGQVLFEKYGGWVRIPTYEILKIVPDLPDPGARTVNLPAATNAETYGAPLRPESDFYVTMQGGGNLRVSGFTPDGDHVRVALANGSFTVPRSEIVSVVRVPPGGDVPEAWLSVLATDSQNGAAGSAGLLPAAPDPRLPYPGSDRPHLLRLANGQLMRVEGFWVEDGEFRFRRLGGIVGVALNEVLRVLPEELAPVRGRTPVRFVRRVAPDLLEVSVRSGPHRVRLVGVAATGGTWTDENPWRGLEQGSIVYLEFDRQRYDAEGNWLAYVFLPSGRMLNAELIRLGLARPAGDLQNARYLDLFHEMAGGEPPPATPEPAEAAATD